MQDGHPETTRSGAATGDVADVGADIVADIIVVGGGIVGRACALRLRQAGLGTILVDAPPALPHRFESASFGNAGHIATEQVRPLTSPALLRSLPRRLFLAGGALDVGWRYPAVWAPWAARALRACFAGQAGQRALSSLLADALPAWQRLAADLGAPGLVAADGHLMLWPEGSAGLAAAGAWRAADIGSARVTGIGDDERDRIAAHLSWRPATGLRFHHTGQLRDVAEALHRLEAAFLSAGGGIRRGRAVRVQPGGGSQSVVLEDGAELLARRVLIAAGVGARDLLRPLRVTMPLIAERGYHVEWDHGGGYDLPPLVFEDRALIVTRFGDRLRAASFVEFTSEAAPPDPRKWRRLEAHVGALGLPRASGFTRWVGARPTLPDYLPALGTLPGHPAILVACGHQHLGLTLAPRTAEIIAGLVAPLVANRGSPVDLAPFDPGRFWSWNTRR